ncbi:restriction endonuclease subunit S [Cronobacter turicensis]
MNDNDKQSLPRLRFQSFKTSGPWVFQPLGKLAQRSIRKNVDGKITRVLTNSAEYGVVDQRDFFEKDIANQGNLEGYYIVEEGSYVYNPRISAMAPVGPISKNKIGLGVMSPLYTVFKFNNNKNDFYAYYFKSTHWHKYMRQVSSTGARHDRMSISNNAFMELPLPVSTPEEQQKIADCLSSLEDVLTLEAQKLDALTTYKRGLLQQLFPCEGERVPRLRFPEFRNAGEWKVKTLSHYVKSLDAGVSVNSGDRPAGSEEIGILKTSCVSSGSFDQTENKVVAVPEEIARVKEPVCADTIIISRMNTIALVGANAYVEKDIPTLFLPDRLWAAKATGNGSMRFLAYVLGSEQGRKNLSILASGSSGSMKNIGKSEVLAIRITAPCIEEQQRIAELLTSLDKLITAQTQKLKIIKTHKKGLMQQIFPILNEA